MLSVPKETHFFSRNYSYGFSWYQRCFHDDPNEPCQYSSISMDICPSYLTSMGALSRLKAASDTSTQAPLLVVVRRDSVSLSQSLVTYRYKRGQIPIASHASLLSSRYASELAAHSAVSAWLDAFPDILVFPFADLIRPGGAARLTADIVCSLGLSPPKYPLDLSLPKLNSRPKPTLISNAFSRYIRQKLLALSPRLFGRF